MYAGQSGANLLGYYMVPWWNKSGREIQYASRNPGATGYNNDLPIKAMTSKACIPGIRRNQNKLLEL